MLKSVKNKIADWLPNNKPIAPFIGTSSDYEKYRNNWVDNCASINSTGFLQSRKNADGQCQVAFDTIMQPYQLETYESNARELAEIQEQNKKILNYLLVGSAIVAVIILIVWLLTSE